MSLLVTLTTVAFADTDVPLTSPTDTESFSMVVDDPTSSESVEDPTSSESVEDPTSSESVEDPTSSESVDDSTSSESIDEITASIPEVESNSSQTNSDPSQNIQNQDENKQDLSTKTQKELVEIYATEYLKLMEGTDNISLSVPKELKDVATEDVVAVCYTLNGSGYAIVDVNNGQVYEYTLANFNPYDGHDNAYYTGPFGYYDEAAGSLTHTVDTSLTFSQEELSEEAINFNTNTSRASKSLEDAIAEIRMERMQRSAPVSYQLKSSLATSWINGYCGPTSAYNMLQYKGLVYTSGSATDKIKKISEYTTQKVNLSTLVSGINNYLEAGKKSTRVGSCSFSPSRIKSELKANYPLTLGTNGGGLASTGHVQTIHKWTEVNTAGNLYVTISVNDSWGHNNITLSYTNRVPSYLKDHVFYMH